MRRLVIALVGSAALLAGCATSPAPRSEAPSAPSVQPSGGIGTSTSPPPATPTPYVPPPPVTVTPDHAPVGATVHLEGDGFSDSFWQGPTRHLWISGSWGDPGCDLYADAEGEVTVDANGHLVGDLVIPAEGTCRQSGDLTPHPVLPGVWHIVLNCTACLIGEIEVTDS